MLLCCDADRFDEYRNAYAYNALYTLVHAYYSAHGQKSNYPSYSDYMKQLRTPRIVASKSEPRTPEEVQAYLHDMFK